jgi:hypothetical protein
MLLRHRGTLTLLTLVVLASVTIGGGMWLLNAPVDPATASRAQVLRTLVLNDLSALPADGQQAWVDRLQIELTSEDALPTGGAGQQLSQGYREQLGRNIGLLQAVWFQTRTAQYVKLPEPEREAFMLEQLKVVGAWGKVASLMDSGPVAPEVATRKLIDRIDHWVQEAKGQQREDMIAAVKDGTLCWLATTDLSDKPLAMKRELAKHLAMELDRGAQPKVAGLVSDSGRRARLVSNAGQLVEAYIYDLAAQFSTISGNARLKFVDEQLAAVQRWGIGELLSHEAPSGKAANRATAALALAEHSKQWVEHAPAEDRPQVQALVTAVQQRLVWQQLPAWMRSRG